MRGKALLAFSEPSAAWGLCGGRRVLPWSPTVCPDACLDLTQVVVSGRKSCRSPKKLRLLEQMERALVAEDPKFVSALRGTARRRDARRRSIIAGGVFLLGVVVLMTGAVMANTLVAIIGFVVMLGSAVVALTYWRSRGNAAAPEPAEAVKSRAGSGSAS